MALCRMNSLSARLMEGTASGPPATVSTAELDRRRGWSDSLTRSCAHWLNWQCGIDMGAERMDRVWAIDVLMQRIVRGNVSTETSA
jgi:hypothetical protein